MPIAAITSALPSLSGDLCNMFREGTAALYRFLWVRVDYAFLQILTDCDIIEHVFVSAIMVACVLYLKVGQAEMVIHVEW